ncbi:MAG: chemotaxis protein CheW [bacterium]
MRALSDGNDGDRVVTFRRLGLTYALPVARVRRVVKVPAVKPVAGAPDFVVGTARLGDRIEVLVDPAKVFGGEGAEAAGRAVLVTCAGRDWGFLADSVGDVLNVAAASVTQAPPFLGGARAAGLRGVLLRGEQEILLLDPEGLLSESERAALPPARAVAD